MNDPIRNRIVEHVVVRAGDLVPHPLNYRRHPAFQQQALAASYREVGFARSLLGYRLADGRIQLIDGHLRRDLDPEMPVTVELLDVDDEEARKLLLTLDPLSQLAVPDAGVLQQLAELTRASTKELEKLWQSLARTKPLKLDEPPKQKEQFLILIDCRDEEEQVQLLQRLQGEGLSCRALIS